MLRKFKERRGCAVPSQLTWPSTMQFNEKLNALVMWLECRFLDTEVDGSDPASVCCVLEQGTLSALLQSTQLCHE